MPGKEGTNAESRERSRAALLRAGADLLVEQHMRNPFASLTVRAICGQAGYSTGALTQHWPTMDDYYKDLAEYLASADAFDPGLAALLKAAEGSAEADALAAIARVADLDLQLLVGMPLYDAMELLNVTWGRTRYRELMAGGYRVFDGDTGKVYGAILARRGREPRPPFDWDRIGVILQALLEGFTLRHKVDPEAAPVSSEPDLSPYATAVAAVLAIVTRPAGDHASTSETLRALLDHQPRPPDPPGGAATATDPAGA